MLCSTTGFTRGNCRQSFKPLYSVLDLHVFKEMVSTARGGFQARGNQFQYWLRARLGLVDSLPLYYTVLESILPLYLLLRG